MVSSHLRRHCLFTAITGSIFFNDSHWFIRCHIFSGKFTPTRQTTQNLVEPDLPTLAARAYLSSYEGAIRSWGCPYALCIAYEKWGAGHGAAESFLYNHLIAMSML